MTRNEVLRRIEDARAAIRQYSADGMEKAASLTERAEVEMIKQSSVLLIAEARTIGASGQQCPTCHGSGRI